MDDKTNAQTPGKRKIVESLDREFARLHVNARAVIEHTPVGLLYAARAATEDIPSELQRLPSIGESVLRGAAAIEQTFGGITSNLWDDPFEWTLPEYLSTPASVCAHLVEVEEIRMRAFSSFAEDDCLLKHVAVPSGDTLPLVDLLLETLLRASGYQAQSALVLKMLSGISLPGFII
jgi:hypothetical protein